MRDVPLSHRFVNLPPPPSPPFLQGVAALIAERGALDIPASLPLTLSTEAGSLGGVPAGGRAFGAAAHPTSQIPTASMLDLYNGGAIDVCVLGAAEVGPTGDVNVSCFPGRAPGCGGFIDISQSARAVVFVGTLTSGGLDARVEGGRLVIKREGRHAKFRRRVQEVTFAASTNPPGRRVLYVTERAVFRLRAPGEGGGLELVEVAPGVDAARDVLARMEFAPAVAAGGVGLMDGRCFEG